MNTRKLKRLERAIDQLFNSDDYLLQPELVLGIYITMLTQSVDDNQPMLSFDEIKDALERANIPLSMKLSVKKQLLELGYVDDDVILKLINIIKGEFKINEEMQKDLEEIKELLEHEPNDADTIIKGE